jgi:hypothetical protein
VQKARPCCSCQEPLIALAIHDPERELGDEESFKWSYSNGQPDIEKLMDKFGATLRLPHAHWYRLVGSAGTVLAERTVEMWLENHLRMLPNVRHAHIVPTIRPPLPFERPHHIERVLDYLQGGFFQLPPACTELDMDVKVLSDYLYSGDEQSDFDVNEHPVEGHSKPWMQIDTLRLRIEDAKYSECFETPSGCALGKVCQQIFKVNPSDVALRFRRSEPGERPNVMGRHSINRGSVCSYLAQPPSGSVNQSVDVVSPGRRISSNELPAAPRATHRELGFHRADSRHDF